MAGGTSGDTAHKSVVNSDVPLGNGIWGGGEVRDVHQPSPPLPAEVRQERWLVTAQAEQAAGFSFAAAAANTTNPPSPSLHEASHHPQRYPLGISIYRLTTRRDSSLASPLPALPEHRSISLRLHRCTSSTNTPPTRLVVRLPHRVLPYLVCQTHT